MRTRKANQQAWLWLAVILLAPTSFARLMAAELKPATEAAFDRYVAAVEQGLTDRIEGREPFLVVDGSPEEIGRARSGEVVVERLREIKGFDVPDGLIHDWVGTAFIARTADQILAIQRDYEHHSGIYPEVKASKLLENNGNDLIGYLRIEKHQVITVVLDTVSAVHYEKLPGGRRFVRSRSTRINQVEDAGTSKETLLPVGRDGGYLWRLNAYWLLEPVDGGTLVECRAVTLTRGIPFLVSWIVKPFVTRVPRESLTQTLTATRDAVLRAFPFPDPPAASGAVTPEAPGS